MNPQHEAKFKLSALRMGGDISPYPTVPTPPRILGPLRRWPVSRFALKIFQPDKSLESMLKSMRKEHPVPYPPLQLFVNQENSVLHETILKCVLFDDVGFFHCHNSRFTQVISFSFRFGCSSHSQTF